MPAWRRPILCLLLIALPLTLVGCGTPRRTPIQGRVTYNGGPLADGSINFLPEDREKGTPGVVQVTEGKYALSGEKGLAPGVYRVSIIAREGDRPAPDAAPGAPRRGKNLVAEPSTVEVPTTGTGEFNFDVK
jgi:hypothetical protein